MMEPWAWIVIFIATANAIATIRVGYEQARDEEVDIGVQFLMATIGFLVLPVWAMGYIGAIIYRLRANGATDREGA